MRLIKYMNKKNWATAHHIKHLVVQAGPCEKGTLARAFHVHSHNIWATSWQTNKMAYVPSKDSDQPGHLPSLMRVFTVCRRKLGCLASYKEPDLWLHVSRSMTKPIKWPVRPAKTKISLGIRLFWSVFALCMKKPLVLSCPLSAHWRLIRLGGFPGWSESLLGAQVILLVLSFCGSHNFKVPFLMRPLIHFFRVTEKKSKNMMGAENLAIVFAPTVMRSPDSNPMTSLLSVGKEQKSMELLIGHYKELFLKWSE